MKETEKKQKKQSAGRNNFNLYRQERSPFYFVRILYQGRRRAFSTGESTIRAAESKAKAVMADIRSQGFDKAIELHCRLKKKPKTISLDPTIEEFVDIYLDASRNFERQPSPPTRDYYIRCLQRICSNARCKKITELTPERIEAFRISYLKEAEKKGRSDSGARTSLNSILRNAKALFSREAMDAYGRLGLDFVSPFGFMRPHRVRLKPYSPLSRDLLGSLWQDARLLRDGDPDAPAPIPTGGSQQKSRKKTKKPPKGHSEKYARLDFRLPNQGAYLLLLLELGLGLRRNEADKAEWSWLHQREDGRWFIEIRETTFFRPKNRERRVLPVEPDLHAELIKFKGKSSFIVPGKELLAKDAVKVFSRRSYRADPSHRALALWLRQRGITDGKPCHLLRKEFGSYVATSFGLFHAQKFLGHSTPVVTDAYYAGLTDIPELKTVQLKAKEDPAKDEDGDDHDATSTEA